MGLSQFQASDFELQQQREPLPQVAIVPPPMVEQPRTIGTLQQLTAKASGEEVGPQVMPQQRTIAPIFKPVPKQDPDFKATDIAATAAPMALAVEDGNFMQNAVQEDVWMDAFSQPSLKPETDVLRSSRLYEKIHQFMNVSALLFIMIGVALQRNKKIDLPSMFVSEAALKPAFETLCQQSLILALFCGAVILTMWNLELLVEATSIYVACECSILVLLCWLAQGGLLLRRAEQQIIQWRSYEETATDLDYLKLKEQQYERLYYQKSRNPGMPIPSEMINEMQHLVQRSHFINPVYLPTLTESFLAKDFDFGEYLALSLGNAINEHLKMHFLALLTALPLLALSFVFLASEAHSFYFETLDLSVDASYVNNGVLFLAFAVTLSVYMMVRVELGQIQRALFPQIMLDEEAVKRQELDELEEHLGGTPPPLVQPEGLVLHQTLENQDLFSPYDELPLPNYLEQECLQEFENRVSRLVVKFFVSDEQLATLSKHELVFGFCKSSRYVVSGLLQIVELSLVVCSAWTIMALGSELGIIVSLIGDVQASTAIPVRLVLPILQINLLAVSFKVLADWLPESIRSHTMATATEMMKDRTVVEQVIQKQKLEKNERNYRVFQAMRLMRREYMKMLF
jgi:hypothetical protein